jgi:hypothetical protein
VDWNNIQTWQYFALTGGGVLVLGLVLYFLPAGKMKIPGVITAAFGGLGAGLALGIVFMAGFGYTPSRRDVPIDTESGEEARLRLMPGGGMPMGPGEPAGPKAPDPRVQLVDLVRSLERVADRPLTITLSTEQRTAIVEQLKGLDAADQITEDSARTRLEAIHKIVEKDRTALEAIGYRGLGDAQGGGRPSGPSSKVNPANPFKGGPAADQLKSLLDRLAKK